MNNPILDINNLIKYPFSEKTDQTFEIWIN